MAGEPSRYELRGFAVPEQLGRVHELLERVGAEHPEIDPGQLMLFETAVVEIATNVVEYGRPRGRVQWRLALWPGDDEIRAELDDSGQEFTPDLGASMPGELDEGGRGLPLARALLDEITFERTGTGNHWHMVRRLNREPA